MRITEIIEEIAIFESAAENFHLDNPHIYIKHGLVDQILTAERLLILQGIKLIFF